jgi:hypothetical protein
MKMPNTGAMQALAAGLAICFLVSCGETKTIQSVEKLSGKKLSPVEQAKKQGEGEEKIFPSVDGSSRSARLIRAVCDDGSSFSSLLTTTLKASDQAFASRILLNIDSDDPESLLILNLRQPVVTQVANDSVHFIFEGALFRNETTTGELFKKNIFLGRFNYWSRESEVSLLGDLKEISSRILARAEDLGFFLKLYGRISTPNAFIFPQSDESADTISGFYWQNQNEIRPIPCPSSKCFNPSGLSGETADHVLFDRYIPSEDRFEVAVFRQLGTEGFLDLPLSFQSEAYQAQFVGSEKAGWLERGSESVHWILYNLETGQRHQISLQDRASDAIRWSPSLNGRKVSVVSWDDSGKLRVGLFSTDSKEIERQISLDVSKLVDLEDDFQVFSYQLIDDKTALISFSTLLGPRLYKIDFSEADPQLISLTRSNCAAFSLGLEGEA